jgi:hypothetical protein
MPTEQDELAEILGNLLGDIPALAKISADFDRLAKRNVGEVKLHSLFSRLSTVVGEFSRSLDHVLSAISPELREQLMRKAAP